MPAGRLATVSSGVGPAWVHLVPDEALLARASVDGLRRLPVVAVVDIRRSIPRSTASRHVVGGYEAFSPMAAKVMARMSTAMLQMMILIVV